MSYFTSIGTNRILNDSILVLVRILVGFAMLSHGYPKLQLLLSGDAVPFYDFIGLGPKISLGLTVFAEFVCSIFIILGLFTRWGAFFLAFTMIIAAVVIHGADSFDKKELSLLYLALYSIILVFGPGRFSVDGMMQSRKTESAW